MNKMTVFFLVLSLCLSLAACTGAGKRESHPERGKVDRLAPDRPDDPRTWGNPYK